MQRRNRRFVPRLAKHRPPPIASTSDRVLQTELDVVEREMDQISPESKAFALWVDKDILLPFVKLLEDNNQGLGGESIDQLDEILEDAVSLIFSEKYDWNFPRPFKVKDLGHVEVSSTTETPSYPSGHSAQARLIARLLSQRSPHLENLLLRLGERIGWSRIQLGYHYPQDHYEGRNLGDNLYCQMVLAEESVK